MPRWLRRVELALFPSVPAGERDRILAAMEGRDQTPVVEPLGEEGDTAGQSGGGGGPFSFGQPLLPGAPACETDLYWQPAPVHRTEFSDAWLGHLVDRWKESS